MKNIFRYTIASFVCLLSAFASAFAGDNDNLNAIRLYKSTTAPDANGMSTITLEQFVTATTTTKVTGKPVDLILVLDNSRSMRNALGNVYKPQTSTSYNYNSDISSLYYKYNDKYYSLEKEITNLQDSYYLSYRNGGTTYYLDGSSTSTTKPTKYTSKTEAIYTGTLYKNKNGTAITGQTFSYSYVSSHTCYYKTGNKSYQEVSAGITSTPTSNSKYLLCFTDDDDVTHYLTGTGDTTTQPTNVTSSTQTIYTGVLYKSQSRTRLDALKDACNEFVNIINENAKGENGEFDTDPTAADYDDVDNRIAIVTFNGSSTPVLSLTDVKDGYNTLVDKINGISTNSGTRPDLGMETALGMLEGIEDGRQSNRVVILFTDGEPTASGTPSSKDNTSTAAIDYSYDMKNTYGAKVFSIGLLDSSTQYTKMDQFMKYASSEYPKATDVDTPGTEHDEKVKYYQKSDGSDLSSIFSAIAQSTTGDTYSLTDSNTSVVDIMSDDFTLPSGFDPTKVEWEIWSCQAENPSAADGYDWALYAHGTGATSGAEGTYVLDDYGTKHKSDEYNGDRPIVTVNTTTNKIQVSGFYYAKSDVIDESTGKVTCYGNHVSNRAAKGATADYAGKKLVLRFQVQVKPNSFGGYDMPSNKSTSGIYDGDDLIKAYPQPLVDYPSIVIIKEGLKAGESAIFDVVGTEVGGSKVLCNYRIILTDKGKDDSGNKIPCFAVIKGLTHGNYTVTETPWTWDYTAATGYVGADETGKEVTKELKDKNAVVLPDDIKAIVGKTAAEMFGMYKARLVEAQTATDYGKNLTDTDPNDENYYVLNDAFCLMFKFVNKHDDSANLHGEDVVHNKFGANGGSAEHGGVEEEDTEMD